MKQMMKNKKAIAVLLLVAMLFSIMPTAVLAEESVETITAYVTIVDKSEIVVAHDAVTVTTSSAIIDDFLYEIHERYSEEYATSGSSLKVLWGDNSGNFGYWVNDASAWSLEDPVSNKEHVVAFIYKDSITWSDSYSHFNLHSVIVENGIDLELNLKYVSGYENYTPIFSPLNKATITIDGQVTLFETNENGKVVISLPALTEYDSNWNLIEKTHIISAVALEGINIVPPVCEVTVKPELTEEDKLNNVTALNSSKVSAAVSLLQYSTPFIVKENNNLFTLVTSLVNDSDVEVTFEPLDNIIDASGNIITNQNKGSVSIPFKLSCGTVVKNIEIPIIVNGLLADSTKLLHNIAGSYVNATNKWNVMDMGTYSRLEGAQYQLSSTAKQNYVNTVINNIQSGEYDKNPSYGSDQQNYSTAVILPLTSIGVDALNLYPKNSNVALNSLTKLENTIPYISEWVTPYTLMAYNQGYGAGENEDDLLTELLTLQDSVSGGFGYSVDSTGEILATLAFYRENNEVETAITNAVRYLSEQIREDGVYTDGYNGYNANSTAMAVIGLAAVYDENNDTITTLFDKSVKGLLSFAVNDNSGFWKAPDTSIANAKATEQGFRALIAASQVMKTGKAFNVYDFSGNTLVAGHEKEITSSGGSGSYVPKDDKITVKVSIKAIDGYWMQNKSVKVDEGASVSDAFLKAIKGTGITQEGAEDGYISYMEYNGEELGEFTHGDNSGWMYKVNGVSPVVGVTDYTLSDGDKILFFFTEDYTKESMDDDEEKGKEQEEKESDKVTTTPVTEVLDDVDGHWAIDAIQYVYDKGLLTGVSDTEFAPDIAVSRAMMAAIMYGMAGTPENGLHYPFTDVLDTAWYAGSVAWAYDNKLIYGITANNYAPETAITREQVAVMLMRYAKLQGYDTSQTVPLDRYKDANNISDYGADAMRWAVAIGMIGGRTADTLCAQDTATRAELSVMLRNFITLYETIDSYNRTTK